MDLRNRSCLLLLLLLHAVLRIAASAWSPWTSWSDCSRTCGGGVSYARRTCVSEPCIGDAIQYKICNAKDCDSEVVDFRVSQCALYNDQKVNGNYYEWIPEFDRNNPPCALYCRARNTSTVELMSPKVLDGTKCYKGSFDTCIDGLCQSVGCDRQLHSKLRFDVCGKCGGDGSSCRLVTGLHLAKPAKTQGTEVVITVPENSRHISVSERGSGHVGLMLNHSADFDLIMPNISGSGKRGYLKTAGVKVEFEALSYGKEYFDVEGPVPKEMQVLAVYDNAVWKYIRYEFYRPLEVFWTHEIDGVSCTVTCGGGLQFIWPICVEISSGRKRDDTDCYNEGLSPPSPKVRRCNTNKCPPSYTEKRFEATFEYMRRNRWLPDPWTMCSSTCAGGIQTRTVSCVEEVINGETLPTADDSPCFAAGLKLPETRRTCNTHSCPKWEAKPWSECSVTCGRGSQYRTVRCLGHDGKGSFSCRLAEKPSVRRDCVVTSICTAPTLPVRVKSEPENTPMQAELIGVERIYPISITPTWLAERWGPCSVSCGVGVTTRLVKCQVLLRHAGTVERLEEEMCKDEKPITERPCSMRYCIPKSATVEINNITDSDDDYYDDASEADYDVDDDVSEYVSEANSDSDYEAINETPSISDDSLNYEWRFQEHGPCTPSCGNGTQTLSQSCFHIATGALVSPDRCDLSEKLDTFTRACGGAPCETPSLGGGRYQWDISPFTDCDVTCGRGIQTRSVICRSMPEGGNLSASALEHPHHHHQPRQGRTMDELMCPKPKPQETRVCSQSKCPPVWKLGAWSKCSRTCGRGIQRRDIACMQKLGTGETTTVPYQHCSRMKPHRLRYCNQVDCPPRYMIKQWSPCRGRCGQSVQVRTVACIGLLAGKTKPQLISTLRCSKLRRPKTRKRCQLPQCSSRGDVTQTRGHLPAESNSGGRVANRRLERFVQLMPKAKVRLDVGTRAFVLTKTTIVVKCRMDDTRKQPTKWRRNRRPIRSRRGSRISVLPDGSLRILYARPTDSGRYTCLTSPSARHFFLKVLDNTTNIQQTLNHDLSSADFDTPTDLRPGRRHFDEPLRNEQEDLDTDDLFPRLEPDLRKNSGPPSSRFHPVILIPPRSHPPQFTYPSISYAQFHPDLIERRKEVKVRDDNSKLRPVEELRPATNEPSKLLLGRPANVIHTVLQFLAESGVKDSSVEIQQLLDQLTEVSTQSEDDNVGDEERLDITTSVIEKLNLLLDRTRNQTSFRGSTRSVNTIERIIRLLEERVVPSTSPPSISSHPTLAPLQLDRDVVAYVGGNLIVTAGAEKVTILCEVTGQPTPEIKWYREGNRITNNKRQFVLGDGSLRLVYPQFSDAGNYVCIASNDHGNDSLATALDVAQIPRILSTTSSLEDFKSEEVEVVIGSYIRAKLGSKIKLMCPTEGYPDPYVEWKKDGAGLRQNVKYLPDNSLEIFPTTAADQGLYGCEATNPAGSDYQASSLVLIDPPHISEELNVIPDIDGVIGLPELLMTGVVEEEYKVKTNSSVIMGCPVAGFPEPKITWFFNNRPLTEFGRRLDYQLMRQDKVLQIPNASEDTEGVYSCHAQNEGGNLTTILVLELIVYTFEFGELTPCTASCGDVGVQYRKLRCMEDQQKKVDEWYCTGLFRPIATMQACNRVDCPPSLVVGPWGQCSVSCGNGTRTRPTSCVILSATGSTREVDRELCVQNLSMTSLTEPCFEGKCPEWIPGPWRPCSRKCLGRGVGGKTRRIHCVAGNGTKIHKKYCIHLPRPIRKSLCPNPRCEPMWTTSAWSGCSQPCGKDGIKTRILNCVYRGRPKQPAGNQCTIRRAPRIKTPCNRKICPSVPCVNRFKWCHIVKRRGKCHQFQKSCCRSCKSS
ncbi:ADAMTS-like protein 1 isoform X2 [Clavelina lepadiformis]|uniref:ADAMTS-like protein 1 isoform X2 n=1 Tax=Clavelina lepadiformis TaxID=159417 RepID=UPI00404127A1